MLGNASSARTSASPIRWVNETLPPRARARWLLMTMRLSASSFAGTARTLVAVGTVSEAFMFLTTLAAAPRRGDCVPAATGGAAVLAAGLAAGAFSAGALGAGLLGAGVLGAGAAGAGAAEAGAVEVDAAEVGAAEVGAAEVEARGGASRDGAGESAGFAATGSAGAATAPSDDGAGCF